MTQRNEATFTQAAYGGQGWRPRTTTMAEELGTIWAACGVAAEWTPLKTVLLHRPGPETSALQDPNAVHMLAPLDLEQAQAQHDAMAEAYQSAGVTVHYMEAIAACSPNQMFMADLFWATPQGVILARPASQVRAGEECQTAANLARLKIPLLRSISGRGTFEGADAMWISPDRVIIGRGLRTNPEGASQVAAVLQPMGVDVIHVDLPYGTMHLMGMLRIVDCDLAVGWPTRLAYAAVEALAREGIKVIFLPNVDEALQGSALNFVTLGPRKILMPAGNPVCQHFYEQHGIACTTVNVDELAKAAGAIGCLTGIVQRELP